MHHDWAFKPRHAGAAASDLSSFRLSEAACTVAGDRERFIDVIESAYGTAAPFELAVQHLLDFGCLSSSNRSLEI